MLLLGLLLHQVAPVLILNLVLSVPKGLSEKPPDLVALHLLDWLTLVKLDVLDHRSHGESRGLVTVDSMAIQNSKDMSLACADAEAVVLVDGANTTLLRGELDVLVGERLLILVVEVLKDVLLS